MDEKPFVNSHMQRLQVLLDEMGIEHETTSERTRLADDLIGYENRTGPFIHTVTVNPQACNYDRDDFAIFRFDDSGAFLDMGS